MNWIDQLLAAADVSPATGLQYRSALRYWEAWYGLKYGDPLPLSRPDPQPVPKNVIDAFEADHMPISGAGELRTSMTADLDARLKTQGFNRGRGCPAASTTMYRLYALKCVMYALGHEVEVLERKRRLESQWRSELAGAGLNETPLPSNALTELLIAACDLTQVEGAHDAAIVILCQRLTIPQVAEIKYGELIPGEIREGLPGAGTNCVWHRIKRPQTEHQRSGSSILYIGWEADILSHWGAYLQEAEPALDEHFIQCPNHVQHRKLWIRRRFRAIAEKASLFGVARMSVMSSEWFRYMWERENRSGTTARDLARCARITEARARALLAKFKSATDVHET